MTEERHYGDIPFRPDMDGILIPGKRGKLTSVLYTAAGEGNHPTVLLLHGIPGCEQNQDLAQELRRAGFHVLIPHYSGSWGSDGEYSLSNDLEDAETALDFLLQDETHGVDKKNLFAAGHSMGGFVCGQLCARRKEIKAGVLLMPCDIGRIGIIRQENEQAYEAVFSVLEESGHWLTGTSGKALLTEALEKANEFRLENLAADLAQKPMLCISGTLDIYIPAAQHCDPLAKAVREAGGTDFHRIDWVTDHMFSDHRVTAAETVTSFLKEQTES